jgi:hypothetical protein
VIKGSPYAHQVGKRGIGARSFPERPGGRTIGRAQQSDTVRSMRVDFDGRTRGRIKPTHGTGTTRTPRHAQATWQSPLSTTWMSGAPHSLVRYSQIKYYLLFKYYLKYFKYYLTSSTDAPEENLHQTGVLAKVPGQNPHILAGRRRGRCSTGASLHHAHLSRPSPPLRRENRRTRAQPTSVHRPGRSYTIKE